MFKRPIDKPEFLNTLVEKLENFSDNTILCGDFNTTLNTDLDIFIRMKKSTRGVGITHL